MQCCFGNIVSPFVLFIRNGIKRRRRQDKRAGTTHAFGYRSGRWALPKKGGFEVSTAVTMKNAVFWDVAPCRSCEMNRRFGGTYRLRLQGRIIRERGTSVSCYLLTLVPCSRIFLPWRWRRYVPPKRRFISQDLHGATSQKTTFFTTEENLSYLYVRILFEPRHNCLKNSYNKLSQCSVLYVEI
jgi:hypothetical protein